MTNGTEVVIPAVATTTPEGSVWRRNPIPTTETGAPFEPPCAGCKGDMNPFSVVDRVAVPADLATGNYTLSWRWDCELTKQVWLNCADITVTAGPAPAQ